MSLLLLLLLSTPQIIWSQIMQIVGGSLTNDEKQLKINFVAR